MAIDTDTTADPRLVILDTYESVTDFRTQMAGVENCDYELKNVVAMIVDTLAVDALNSQAQQRLRPNFYDQPSEPIKFMLQEFSQRQSSPGDQTRAYTALENLTEVIKTQMSVLSMENEHYAFYGMLGDSALLHRMSNEARTYVRDHG